jgi:ketosteroid isomerase-like protein
MSQENVEIIRMTVEAADRGDAEAIAAICDDDIEFSSAVLGGVEEGTFRGKGAWETYFSRMRETWEEWRFEDAEVFEADDEQVVAVMRLVGVGRGSGARVEHPLGIAYKFRDGKLWRMRAYLDPREALEAVGLRN